MAGKRNEGSHVHQLVKFFEQERKENETFSEQHCSWEIQENKFRDNMENVSWSDSKKDEEEQLYYSIDSDLDSDEDKYEPVYVRPHDDLDLYSDEDKYEPAYVRPHDGSDLYSDEDKYEPVYVRPAVDNDVLPAPSSTRPFARHKDTKPNALETMSSQLVDENNAEHKRETRIVLVGKTGSGKSATGNALLGQKCFESMASGHSVTKQCFRGESVHCGRKVVVVDTPGLFDTKMSKPEITESIIHCVSMSVPGPHVFLIVLQIGRFTKEEVDALSHLFEIFGDGMKRCSILVFTGLDNLERDGQTIKDYIGNTGEPLQTYIDTCKGRYFALNNAAPDSKKMMMIKLLFSKIDDMILENEGKCYSSQIFQLAENTNSAIRQKRQSMQRNGSEKLHKRLTGLNIERDGPKDDRELKRYPSIQARRQLQEEQTQRHEHAVLITAEQMATETIYEELKINTLTKLSELEQDQKRRITETIDKATETTCLKINSLYMLLKEKNDQIERIRMQIQDANSKGDRKLQKRLVQEETKLTKQKHKIIRECKNFEKLMHIANLIQQHLTKRTGMCKIM